MWNLICACNCVPLNLKFGELYHERNNNLIKQISFLIFFFLLFYSVIYGVGVAQSA
jgi:hypothetical protein